MVENGKRKQVTLHDIARRTGYSVNTVSHALRYKEDISPKTAQHIREVASQMGYTVNQLASALRSGRTRVLAVIVGNISNPYYGILADTIQDEASARGYGLMIMCSREDPALELQMVDSAIARRVDGVLLFPSARSGPTIARLRDHSLPFVLMGRCLEGVQADCVVADEAQGARMATHHLIKSGGKRLAYISDFEIVYSGRERVRGFISACDEAGIAESDRLVRIFAGEAGERTLAERLLRLKQEGYDSLFVFCDVEAWHVIDALQRTEGLSRDDFRIASFDNLEESLSYPISLCSVGCDYGEMARQGIELLRLRIHQDERPPQTIVCATRLSCRGSCQVG